MNDFQIFISYRRSGGADFAGRLNDRLTNMGYKVFFDVDSMVSGTFDSQLLDAIDICDDILLVLPQGALDRCDNPEDFVRIEIEYALKKNKNIIPIMIGGFSFPEYLPECIDKIRIYEGVTAYNEYFGAAMERVCSLLISKPAQDVDRSVGEASGKRFLEMKLYDKAISCLESEISNDTMNSELYFYLSVALLRGKRPFLSSKADIQRIEGYMETAIAMQEKSMYYCFCSYIKYDFYSNKHLKTDLNYVVLYEIAKTLGLTYSDVQELFALLKTNKPDWMI